MRRILEAVFEDGVLKPLEAIDLPEHQRVTVTVSLPAGESPADALAAWGAVYEGLSDQEVGEIEQIAFDRAHFMAPAS